MLAYCVKRLGSLMITLLVASFFIFVITQLLPGDVAQMILGQYATPESLNALRDSLGLHDPFFVRYFKWMSGVLHGDLGTSMSISGVQIFDLLAERSRNSFFLAFWATFFIVPPSLLVGTAAGLKRDSWLDKLITLSSMVAISLPEFVTGVLFILLFSLTLNILPSASSIDPTANLMHEFPKLILPILTLSMVLLGYVARMTRASVIEVVESNYIKTAVLKGIPYGRLVVRHILRNALIPSITVIAMNVGWLIGGLVVVETLFAFPGLGSLPLYGIVQRDVPLIQDTALFVVAVYMVLNLLADFLYTLVNPRIRYRDA